MIPILDAAASARATASITLVAQQPASRLLRERGFAVDNVDVDVADSVHSAAFAKVLAAAELLLDRVQPDAILTGMSGPGAGIDEALLGRSCGAATYCVQDFGGSTVPSTGYTAGTYFVPSRDSARKLEQLSLEAIVTGPLQYVGFPRLNPSAYRHGERRTPAITFFGQPLWALPGYTAVLASLGGAIKRLCPSAKAVYRPHPKETPDDSARAEAIFAAAGFRLVVDNASALEPALADADAVVTCFSACGIDHVIMHANSTEPLGGLLYLLTEADLREHLAADTGDDMPWPARHGFALVARASREVEPLLARTMSPQFREALWRRVHEDLDLEPARPELVVNTICARLNAL